MISPDSYQGSSAITPITPIRVRRRRPRRLDMVRALQGSCKSTYVWHSPESSMCRVDPVLIGGSTLAFYFSGVCSSYPRYVCCYFGTSIELGYIRLWQRACVYGPLEWIEQVSVLALVCDIGGIIATLHLCDTVRFSYCFLIHNSR